ncbi:MAG: hypothetical protein DRI44_09190 [Chlamydiae bacterium]|nr:MAG: hypothetical protein DRI44_09190 [Chlamydiota bacterium]
MICTVALDHAERNSGRFVLEGRDKSARSGRNVCEITESNACSSALEMEIPLNICVFVNVLVVVAAYVNAAIKITARMIIFFIVCSWVFVSYSSFLKGTGGFFNRCGYYKRK